MTDSRAMNATADTGSSTHGLRDASGHQRLPRPSGTAAPLIRRQHRPTTAPTHARQPVLAALSLRRFPVPQGAARQHCTDNHGWDLSH